MVPIDRGDREQIRQPGNGQKFQKASKKAVIISVICLLVSGLSPSRNDWYLIIGGYYVTHIEGIDKLPANTVAAMNRFLEEYTEGQKPECGAAERPESLGSSSQF